MTLYPCHTYWRSAGDRCALSDFENIHQSAVKSPKNVKSMTPSSFIVAHSTILTRSHCDHLRSLCDSRTLSTHSYCALYALSAPKSSLRFHYVLRAFITCALRLRYACIEYSATLSVYFYFQQLSERHNKHILHSHLSTIMVALPLRVLRYKSAIQSETRTLRANW